MEVVCPFCGKAKDLQREYLGLVNVPCECGAVGVINRADALHKMTMELAGIFEVAEVSVSDFDVHEPVRISMGAETPGIEVPMMIKWARRKYIPV